MFITDWLRAQGQCPGPGHWPDPCEVKVQDPPLYRSTGTCPEPGPRNLVSSIRTGEPKQYCEASSFKLKRYRIRYPSRIYILCRIRYCIHISYTMSYAMSYTIFDVVHVKFIPGPSQQRPNDVASRFRLLCVSTPQHAPAAFRRHLSQRPFWGVPSHSATSRC